MPRFYCLINVKVQCCKQADGHLHLTVISICLGSGHFCGAFYVRIKLLLGYCSLWFHICEQNLH